MLPPNAYSLLQTITPISSDHFDKLSLYAELLVKWQSKINLISHDTIDAIWHRHFMDSAQLYPIIKEIPGRLMDMGSGSGFPGLVLAILGKQDCVLVESDQKKCAFLREVARQTETKIEVQNIRIETYLSEPVSILVSRACASLQQLFTWSEHLVSHETICLFPKGKNYSTEIEEAMREWQFELELIPSITDAQSKILSIKHLQRRNS